MSEVILDDDFRSQHCLVEGGVVSLKSISTEQTLSGHVSRLKTQSKKRGLWVLKILTDKGLILRRETSREDKAYTPSVNPAFSPMAKSSNLPAHPEPRITMRSRSPLLASRASKSTVALMRHDCEKHRVDARDPYVTPSVKGVARLGSLVTGRKDAMAVEDTKEPRVWYD